MQLIRKVLPSMGSRVYFYNYGTIYPVISDFSAYKYSGGSATLTKNTDRLTLALVTGSGWGFGTTQIDLTNYKTLYFYGSTSHASATTHFAVATNNTLLTNAAEAVMPNNNANAWVSLDVSSLSGNHNLRFGYFSASGSMNVNCYALYGVRG